VGLCPKTSVFRRITGQTPELPKIPLRDLKISAADIASLSSIVYDHTLMSGGASDCSPIALADQPTQ
jgi:hypothetical protein